MTNDTSVLNVLHGIPDRLVFKEGAGGLVFAEVINTNATGRIYIQGAHVTHFSNQRIKNPCSGTATPACMKLERSFEAVFPFIGLGFADHPTDGDKPAHGFVRPPSGKL